MTDAAIARCLDANINRAAEGLRALEDCARFLLDDATLSARAKDLRHRLRATAGGQLVQWRDTAGDVGCTIKADDEAARGRLADLIAANAKRAQEALRVCDEYAKLGGGADPAFEALRYASYDLERDLQARLPVARLWRERLYVLLDAALCQDPLAVAQAAVDGGAGVIQWRDKASGIRAYAEQARAICSAVQAAGALFVVNDHVAVAAAIGADGIHVGQDDLSLADVRRVVGPCVLIGASAHTREQAQAAVDGGADYCGLGPMFATGTKPHEPARGPALLDAVGHDFALPSYAIGGLDVERVADLRPRLPHGICVAGAVCGSADPAATCRQLLAAIDG